MLHFPKEYQLGTLLHLFKTKLLVLTLPTKSLRSLNEISLYLYHIHTCLISGDSSVGILLTHARKYQRKFSTIYIKRGVWRGKKEKNAIFFKMRN